MSTQRKSKPPTSFAQTIKINSYLVSLLLLPLPDLFPLPFPPLFQYSTLRNTLSILIQRDLFRLQVWLWTYLSSLVYLRTSLCTLCQHYPNWHVFLLINCIVSFSVTELFFLFVCLFSFLLPRMVGQITVPQIGLHSNLQNL